MRRILLAALLLIGNVAATGVDGCFCCEDWQIPTGSWRHDDWEGIQWPATHQGTAHAGLGYDSCGAAHIGYGNF